MGEQINLVREIEGERVVQQKGKGGGEVEE